MSRLVIGYGLVFVGWALLVAALLTGPTAGIYAIGTFGLGMAALLGGMRLMQRKRE